MTTEPTKLPAPAPPVVVRPIPASQSRTLWTARWATIATFAAAALPTIASVILDAIGNPVIAALIANEVPVEYRAGIAIVFSIIIRRFAHLRMVTMAPIAGTESARVATLADMTVQSAPASTTEQHKEK